MEYLIGGRMIRQGFYAQSIPRVFDYIDQRATNRAALRDNPHIKPGKSGPQMSVNLSSKFV